MRKANEDKIWITIKHKKDGDVLYEGENRRIKDSEFAVCKLGIPIKYWLVIGGFCAHLGITQFNFNHLQALGEKVEIFMEHSDNFNSSVYGTRFQAGQPIDPAYRAPKITEFIHHKQTEEGA